MNVKLLLKIVKASLYSIAFISIATLPYTISGRFIPEEVGRIVVEYIGYEDFIVLVAATALFIWLSFILEDHIVGVIPLILSYATSIYLILSATHSGLYILNYKDIYVEIDFKQLLTIILTLIISILSIRILRRFSKIKY